MRAALIGGPMRAALSKLVLSKFAVLSLMLVAMPLARAAPYAYVTNEVSDTVSVINTANNKVVATIGVGDIPQGVAVSPDGGAVYVANRCAETFYCGAGSVSVINAATNQVVDTIAPQYFPGPFGVALSPNGAFAYVTIDDRLGTVSVIRTSDDTIVATINVDYGPRGVVVSPDGSRVYVVNTCGKDGDCRHGTLSVIETTTHPYHVIDTILLGRVSAGIAMSPDGSRIYATNELDGTVSVVDTETDKVVATIPVGSIPSGAAVSPDGSRIYVSNWDIDTVSVIDAATNRVIDTITTGAYPAYPSDVAFSPDGSRVYATNYGSDTVAVIDAATNQVVDAIPVGTSPFPAGQFIGPGALIAKNSEASGPAGTQVNGTVPALANATTCPTTYVTVKGPTHGQLDFSGATGEFTFTPDSSTYSGPDPFTWRGEAPASCTTADNPIDPVSNTAVVLLALNPTITGLGNITVKENHSAQESFSLAGSAPFTLTLSSNNPPLLSKFGLTLNPANCGAGDAQLSCTLAIAPATNMTGVATIQLSAVDAHGDKTQGDITVTVTSAGGGGGSKSGGGGGAMGVLVILLLAAFSSFAGLSRRGLRHES